MRKTITLTALLFAGCVAAPEPPPPLPAMPPPVSQSSSKPVGEQVADVHRYCLAAAAQDCPGTTIRCVGFRRGFMPSCLLKGNVPAEYITALTRD